ncbi:MAG: hypothetical protein NUV50_03935 [Rhodospirillales bacterium]|nr:hypothetical protein [Rhodospirillales bacterium]
MATERVQICTLRLVYPPISNQEAEWLRHDSDVQDRLRESNFYMIGRRAEAKFENLQANLDDNTINFEFVTGSGIRDHVQIGINELPNVVANSTAHMEIESGPKFVRVWATDQEGGRTGTLLDWFTTEKLLFDKWRGKQGIHGLDLLRDLARYELLYAGISKQENAFERLLNKPHDKRLRILANEQQVTDGARVTDETFLFFFKTDVFRVHTYDIDDDFHEMVREPDLSDTRILADAEKAYISFIQSRYNTIKYKCYPRGADGLFGTGLNRYCYVIGEDLTFHGPGATIVGAFEASLPASNDADGIFVEGENAVLIKAQDMAQAVADIAARDK